MRNILYIGPYYDNNGLGRSARRYIRCLGSNKNINLACRPIYFVPKNNDHIIENMDNIDIYERNMYDSYDCLIQHGYPDMFEYHKGFGKNIGITQIETMNVGHTGWVEKINLLDRIIVGSEFSEESLQLSGVNIPISVMPEPYESALYFSETKNFFGDYTNTTSPYIFYNIGQYNEKNNIKAILVAFMLEFNQTDTVKLFIKTDDYNMPQMMLEDKIKDDMQIIQRSLRISTEDMPEIDILCGPMKDADIIRLHRSCNCYIDVPKADSSAACAIEAILANTLVMTHSKGAANTYIKDINGLIVDSSASSVYTSEYFNKNSFTIYENWNETIISSLRANMRIAYDMSIREYTDKTSRNNLSFFDHVNISERLYEYCF